MVKSKSLGDYINAGYHEVLGFVRDENSLKDTNPISRTNRLGRTYFGVLVFIRTPDVLDETKNNKVKFFYKDVLQETHEGSGICYSDFGYNAKVINEFPISVSATFSNNYRLDKKSKDFDEAKKLLQKFGIY